jgi:hemerythrin-like metal-binding protein
MTAQVEKKPMILVGYEDIDQDHREFEELVEKLSAADNVSFATVFDELLEHTRQHFERENELMVSSQYPAVGEHRGEHNRVLGEFEQFRKRVQRGLIPFGRAFVQDRLQPWFQLHITTMDAALAAHLRDKNNA